jgi:hypothetical protein
MATGYQAGAKNFPPITVADQAALRAGASQYFIDSALASIVATQNAAAVDLTSGSSFYRWDAASVVADDNFFVIKPTDIAGAGRWVALTLATPKLLTQFLTASRDNAFVYSHPQSVNAAGLASSFTAQQGRAGFIGGKFTIAAGSGGTPGTELGGGIDLELQQLVGGSSSALRLLMGASGVLATLARDNAAAGLLWTLGSQNWKVTCAAVDFSATAAIGLTSSGSTVTLKSGTGDMFFDASTKTFNYRSGAGALGRADVNDSAGACSMTWQSGVTSVALNSPSNIRTQIGSTTYIEASLVAASRNVVGLCVGANLDTTKMPANTGNGVLFWGHAGTAPTANPNTTGIILYAESSFGLRSRESNGFNEQITTIDKTNNGGTTKKIERWIERITTTANTIATIGLIKTTQLTGKGCALCIARLTGYDTSGDTIFSAVRMITVKAISGALTVNSSTMGTDVGAPAITIDVSSDVRFRITPPNANDTRWSVHFDLYYVEH